MRSQNQRRIEGLRATADQGEHHAASVLTAFARASAGVDVFVDLARQAAAEARKVADEIEQADPPSLREAVASDDLDAACGIEAGRMRIRGLVAASLVTMLDGVEGLRRTILGPATAILAGLGLPLDVPEEPSFTPPPGFSAIELGPDQASRVLDMIEANPELAGTMKAVNKNTGEIHEVAEAFGRDIKT